MPKAYINNIQCNQWPHITNPHPPPLIAIVTPDNISKTFFCSSKNVAHTHTSTRSQLFHHFAMPLLELLCNYALLKLPLNISAFAQI
jgi:hypothetical protein